MTTAPGSGSLKSDFDPYYKWLGIPPEEQPPNHYRLLGLRLLEDDVDVIRNAALRQSAYLRNLQVGPHAELTERLLNEIAAAKGCLQDPQRKAEYDATLVAASSNGPVGAPPPAASAAPLTASAATGTAASAAQEHPQLVSSSLSVQHVAQLAGSVPRWAWIAGAGGGSALGAFLLVLWLATSGEPPAMPPTDLAVRETELAEAPAAGASTAALADESAEAEPSTESAIVEKTDGAATAGPASPEAISPSLPPIVQHVFLRPSAAVLAADDPLDLEVFYKADTGLAQPAPLALRVHFDSAELRYVDLGDVYRTAEATHQVRPDTNEGDNDLETDCVLEIRWSRPWQSSAWDAGLALLARARFARIGKGTGQTTLRVTAGAMHSLWNLSARPLPLTLAGPRTIHVADVELTEPETEAAAEFILEIVPPAREEIALRYETADDSAVAGDDYRPASGTLTIPAGAKAAQLAVTVLGDDRYEKDESFQLRWGPGETPTGRVVPVEPQQAFCVIHSTDPSPDHAGPLAGLWQSVSGSVFRVLDDGTRVRVEVVASVDFSEFAIELRRSTLAKRNAAMRGTAQVTLRQEIGGQPRRISTQLVTLGPERLRLLVDLPVLVGGRVINESARNPVWEELQRIERNPDAPPPAGSGMIPGPVPVPPRTPGEIPNLFPDPPPAASGNTGTLQ